MPLRQKYQTFGPTYSNSPTGGSNGKFRNSKYCEAFPEWTKKELIPQSAAGSLGPERRSLMQFTKYLLTV
jgi:hypothetical protein